MENLPQKFSETNVSRALNADGFALRNPLDLYLAVALNEEAGEVAGVVKKMYRGFNGREAKKMIKKLNKEWEEKCKAQGEETIEYPAYDMKELEKEWLIYMTQKLAEELADVFTYLDLIASTQGIDLSAEVVKKFNKVNKEMNFPEKYNI